MKKIILQNLSITLLSKLFGFVTFVYVAKFLTAEEYGSFVYITMLVGLMPLLQFGSMHGIAILLPKYIHQKNSLSGEEIYLSYNGISHLLQLFSIFALWSFDIPLGKLILGVISVNYFFSKYIENVQLYFNSTLEFSKVNAIKSFDQVLRPLVTLGVFSLYKNIDSIFWAQLLSTSFTLVVVLYLRRFNVRYFSVKKIKSHLIEIYSIGFFIYLVWAIDILFRTLDRWYISQFYTLKELAAYGFSSGLAMNIWLVSLAYLSPYTQLLYKSVAENDYVRVYDVVRRTNKHLYILITVVSILAIFFYPLILDLFIKKYYETNLLFASLVVVSLCLSINNMYIYYMISNKKYFILLKYQAFILILNIVLNAIIAFYHLDIICFSYSTIITLIFYFLLVRNYYLVDIEKMKGKCFEASN